MTEFIENIFSTIFGDNVILATILIAMVPIIELKGAIPFSMAVDIWGANALQFLPAFLCGVLGSSLIVPILALVYLPIIRWLKRTKLFKNLAIKIENKINKKKDKIDKKVEERVSEEGENLELNNEQTLKTVDIKVEKNITKIDNNTANIENKETKQKTNKSFWIKFFSVFTFVAIPLPLTGVWTGTCLAVVLGLNFWQTCVCVIPANILAGIIITFISTLFGDSTWVFVLILLALILLIFIVYLIKKGIQKIRKNKQQN